jgi:hypothetical protein
VAWDRDEKLEILKHLTAMIVSLGGEADNALFLGYAIGLDGLTVEEIKRGCARALRTCKYIPKPAELRELSGEVSIEHRATLAWDAVKLAIERHSGYRSVAFDDLVIHAAINSIGGWQHVCEQSVIVLDRDMWPRFQRAYKAFAARGSISSADAGPLLGIFASDATLRGNKPPEVISVDTGLGMTVAIAAPSGDQSRPALPSAVARIGVIES